MDLASVVATYGGDSDQPDPASRGAGHDDPSRRPTPRRNAPNVLLLAVTDNSPTHPACSMRAFRRQGTPMPDVTAFEPAAYRRSIAEMYGLLDARAQRELV